MSPQRDCRRVRLVPGGPALIDGPVEIVTEDGATVRSDRFTVAMCRCKRSGIYPLCDTSHRRRKPVERSEGG
ncbi:CDGSH iron-sulfur domain-containing protein [Rhodococcus sp. HNM0569]|uniref:CDGSH iron-sulfur domain-containing protein n=1 Tax=Rhodococcus sp. HNM0569 TaxID=2716340 RepID=UPI00146B0832|nr:CDGSH iron-sulfur domain-containing protein [Rhodococcus sp. HNM0569]NLU83548.1 CDGSH iron-sulfur domain-containing protein [Rhodococcus sp. HNM0569]